MEEEIRISSRNLEHTVAVLRNGSSTAVARDSWKVLTSLVVDHPNVEQAFEEGWQAALREMDREINYERELERQKERNAT